MQLLVVRETAFVQDGIGGGNQFTSGRHLIIGQSTTCGNNDRRDVEKTEESPSPESPVKKEPDHQHDAVPELHLLVPRPGNAFVKGL